MKKFGSYFLEECKRSKWFILILFFELCCCLLLTNIAIHFVTVNARASAYYNASMAENYFVEFDGGRTLDELSETADIGELATMSVIGNVDGQDVRVVTPAVIKNMPRLGLKFSKKLPKDYREIYVNSAVSDAPSYEKGKLYDMVIENGGELKTVKVKVIGYIDNDTSYYAFIDRANILTNYNEIIMCDELSGGDTVKSGIFFNDVDGVALKKAGFSIVKMKELYNDTESGLFISMAVIVVILTTACVLTNYLINVDKMRKRYAVQYVTGLTYDVMYAAEILKVAAVFVLAVLVNVVLTAFLKTDALYGTGLAGYGALGHSVWIIGLAYAIALGVGLYKLTKVEPLESVKL